MDCGERRRSLVQSYRVRVGVDHQLYLLYVIVSKMITSGMNTLGLICVILWIKPLVFFGVSMLDLCFKDLIKHLLDAKFTPLGETDCLSDKCRAWLFMKKIKPSAR
jgi:hypothetical protein